MNPSPDSPENIAEPALSSVVIPLLKGVVYQENDAQLWGRLITLDAKVRDCVRVLELELVLDESEGYAFLRSRDIEGDGEPAITKNTPRLYARRPLSFSVSLLLALLRKKLVESDASGGATRLVLTHQEIVEMLRVFLPPQDNEVRLVDQIETHLNKIAELGFVRKLKSLSGSGHSAAYEIRRILKAFVDAQWLAEFDVRLAAYRAHLQNNETEAEGNES